MNYLDYLVTHTYDELPAAVQAEIDPVAYSERRLLALEVGPVMEGLPPALAAAFSEATRGARPQVQAVDMKSGARMPWLLAAAGWLLLAVVSLAYFVKHPEERLVYKTVESEPVVIIKLDTVYQTKVETRGYYRTIRDTVVVSRPIIEYVVVTDTLYVPMPLGNSPLLTVSGSRSLAERQEVTRFLVGAE